MRTCILLSTFNGAMYVREQLQSLLLQSVLPSCVVIRDDGSTDSTLAIVGEVFTGSDIEVTVSAGKNMGPQESFRELMLMGLKTNADVFFFCDQDDVWEETKIEVFLREFIHDPAVPMAVFSRLLLVDAGNAPIGLSRPPNRIGLGNALVENVMTGCALAINRSQVQIAARIRIDPPIMHDHHVYILASLFGRSRYIEAPLTRYRQHGGNVVGYSSSFWDSIFRKVGRIARGEGYRKSLLAEQILTLVGDDISPSQRETLRLVSDCPRSLLARLRLVLSGRLWRQKLLDEIAWRILCLSGHF